MKKLLEKYHIKELIPINTGWSKDIKKILISEDETKYILKESNIDLYNKKTSQYFYIKEISNLGINMTKVIDKGVLDNGNFFLLLTYIEGLSAIDYVATLNDIDAYNLGVEAGINLKKIHDVPVVHPTLSWKEQYAFKFNRKIELYKNSQLKVEKGEFLLQYYINHVHLIDNRPLVYTHGDYHLGNMVIDNGKLGIIDLDKIAIADPYDDLKTYGWSALVSEYFASGLINGYFNNNIPKDFFEILKFYTTEALLGHLAWAYTFGEEEIKTAYIVYNKTMEWYDDYKLTVPTWFKKI